MQDVCAARSFTRTMGGVLFTMYMGTRWGEGDSGLVAGGWEIPEKNLPASNWTRAAKPSSLSKSFGQLLYLTWRHWQICSWTGE